MLKKNKILLVDDHPLVREWLSNLINEQPDLHVCGGAANAPDAIDAISACGPDIVIVDLALEGGSGIDLIKNIRKAHPKVATIVLSMHDESLFAERALRAGARGYIMKREATKKILLGIRSVLGGKVCISDRISEAMAEKLFEGNSTSAGSPVQQLSDRELEVFQLLGRGFTTRQISEHLNIGFKTVQAYCARIKEKLNLDNITELLREAIRWHERRQQH
jgi:DNA-binding NarL/FixJ family response regulator